jgi:hypothetical protein
MAATDTAAKATDKAAAAKTRAVKTKLGLVERKGTRYAKTRNDVLQSRGQLDAAILDARQTGASYKDIAAAAGVSVSWVQTSLGRSGYQPEGRVRGNSSSGNSD